MSLPGSPPLLSPGSGAPTPAALYRSAPDALLLGSGGPSSPGGHATSTPTTTSTNSHAHSHAHPLSLSPSPRLTSSMLSAFLPGPGGALAGLGNGGGGGAAPLLSGGGGAAPLLSGGGGGAALGPPLGGLGPLHAGLLTPGSPGSPGPGSECRLVEVHGVKVASFGADGHELICLPQVFDLFLKHLVGGLHTVYTKLKRLDVAPVVCTVEQVRVLRGLGAIQPGVNRCKLISRKDFEVLYQDCTSARWVEAARAHTSKEAARARRGFLRNFSRACFLGINRNKSACFFVVSDVHAPLNVPHTSGASGQLYDFMSLLNNRNTSYFSLP
ncbi:Dachshund 2 [Liparis tanakae]|uniref:Dachshund 2 n=1 Tax=Liparis tanakae TaxID=230148 RepID=A0A4Z2E0Q7_9TELE|nr:Dachshund 2 [Liparis tanakae]